MLNAMKIKAYNTWQWCCIYNSILLPPTLQYLSACELLSKPKTSYRMKQGSEAGGVASGLLTSH